MPFEADGDTKNISEELRLKYRYLDLTSERMKKNLEVRHTGNLFSEITYPALVLENRNPILNQRHARRRA